MVTNDGSTPGGLLSSVCDIATLSLTVLQRGVAVSVFLLSFSSSVALAWRVWILGLLAEKVTVRPDCVSNFLFLVVIAFPPSPLPIVTVKMIKQSKDNRL